MAIRNANWLSVALLATLTACAAPPPASPPAPRAAEVAAPSTPAALEAAYERSIRAAAVRDPGFAVDLRTIDPTKPRVTVGTFTPWGLPPSPTQRPIWVSLPEQLHALCHGKSDPVLAIEEALGLPPMAQPPQPQQQWQVITFTLPPAALFRPCPGGTDIAAPRCLNTLAKPADPHTPPAATLDPATTRFLLDQIWSSDRVGFRTASGDPDWGYPFTGMGWTYNWDPQAASPVGVSEFVVRVGSKLTALHATAAAQFCSAPGP
jgi:hypothetical protein